MGFPYNDFDCFYGEEAETGEPLCCDPTDCGIDDCPVLRYWKIVEYVKKEDFTPHRYQYIMNIIDNELGKESISPNEERRSIK